MMHKHLSLYYSHTEIWLWLYELQGGSESLELEVEYYICGILYTCCMGSK